MLPNSAETEILMSDARARPHGSSTTGSPTHTATLRADPRSPERDQYDRILAYVEADGVDVGQTMLAEGFADLYTGNQDLLRWSNYTDTYRDRAEPQCIDGTSH